LGHEAVGLDGSLQFVAMARSHSQCDVLHQDFLAMQLPESRFDGVFANASLFHVPSQEMLKVLLELLKTSPKTRGSRPAMLRRSWAAPNPPNCPSSSPQDFCLSSTSKPRRRSG
jgi:hypothetical protein